MKVGKLEFSPAGEQFALVAASVQQAIERLKLAGVWAAAMDPALADTAAFCKQYGIGLDISANCVIVEAKRADRTWYAACVILATTKADINGAVRRHLDARKLSFAPMDKAVSLTGMEYGGITPLGLPADWPILVDSAVAATPHVVIGSGHRGSKLWVPGRLLADLPNATVLPITKHED